jgi:hypothetical protein
MLPLRRLLSIAIVSASTSTAACGSVVHSDASTGSSGSGGTAQGGSQGSGAAAGQGGSGQGGSGQGGSGQGGSGQGGSGAGTTGTGPCGCSGDLQSVLGCDGSEIEKCAPDTACTNGACVADPCVAAEIAQTSEGCDFWALETTLPLPQVAGACFAVTITNAWSSPAHIAVSYDGGGLDPSKFGQIVVRQGGTTQFLPFDSAQGLPPGQTLVLFLAGTEAGMVGQMTACPVSPALPKDPGFLGTGRGKAFHVTADRPVVAAQLLPYWAEDGFSSTSLLLPASAWRNDYLAINPYPAGAFDLAAPTLEILAKEDGTLVSLVPKVPVMGGPGVDPASAGASKTYALGKGEYLQIRQPAELTGSTIHANKPIAVLGAAACLEVPLGADYCDSAQQMLPPVQAMGHEYVAVRYSSRKAGEEEPTLFRLVGAANGTKLTWEPAPPAGAPATLSQGQAVEIDTPGPFVVRSQDQAHPFYLAAYMTGGDAFTGKGDPDWVNVVPTEQYLRSYDLFANPEFSDNELVIVRAPDKAGAFQDVTLDCAGVLSGWKPVGGYQFVRVPLGQAYKDVGGCSTATHHLHSAAPFGVTSWGIGDIIEGSSAAFPAGTGLAPLNGIVFP